MKGRDLGVKPKEIRVERQGTGWYEHWNVVFAATAACHGEAGQYSLRSQNQGSTTNLPTTTKVTSVTLQLLGVVSEGHARSAVVSLPFTT